MDKDLLLKPRLPEADVEIPGVGTVRVRGLSHQEVLIQRKAADDDNVDGPRALAMERKMLTLAMVDPAMTEAEVGEWQRTSPAGDIKLVFEAVQALSGLQEGAAKAAYKSVPGQPGA